MTAADPAAGRSIVYLVGFMGSGKSTVGRQLAAALGWRFEDTDALVEQAARCTIDEIFRREGEGRFRGMEAGILANLAVLERCVVATGGGLFLGREQRRLMKRSGWTVWLDLDLEVARRRVGAGDGRPLWTADDPVELRSLFEKRRASYALAHLQVEAGDPDPGRVARRILSFFVDSGGKLVIDRPDCLKSWEEDA